MRIHSVPAFIEAILKVYRMSETGVTTPRGKIITDEQGKPIRLEAAEGIAPSAGFRPERLARISGEHWTMENVQKHFKEKRDDLYSPPSAWLRARKRLHPSSGMF